MGECQEQSKPFEKKGEFPLPLAVVETLFSLCPESIYQLCQTPCPPSPPPASLLRQRAEDGGLEAWQRDGTALEEQALIRGSMDLVPLEWDTGPGDPD